MAKAPPRKLKVLQARLGFYDCVVAAPSQAAALRAWGTRQNLFADGQASIATDAKAVEGALSHPQIPLLRAVGTDHAFEVKPTGLPKIPDAPKRPPARTAASARPAPKAPKVDRSALDAAEAALRKLDDTRKREEADLQRRQDDLDQRKASTREAYVQARKAASAAATKARQAWRKAGGEG